MLTEFGGIAYSPGRGHAGATAGPATAEAFAERYAQLLAVVRALPVLAGFCYTQFADTYQEANGLLYADRTPKFPLEEIARATRGPGDRRGAAGRTGVARRTDASAARPLRRGPDAERIIAIARRSPRAHRRTAPMGQHVMPTIGRARSLFVGTCEHRIWHPHDSAGRWLAFAPAHDCSGRFALARRESAALRCTTAVASRCAAPRGIADAVDSCHRTVTAVPTARARSSMRSTCRSSSSPTSAGTSSSSGPSTLMTRLAADRPVLFVEEPVHAPDGAPRWEYRSPPAGVTVCRPHTPVRGRGFSDEQIAASCGRWSRELLAGRGRRRVRSAGSTRRWRCRCADGLDAAGRRLRLHGRAVGVPVRPAATARSARRNCSRRADVVFTGGPSLYRAKKDRHPNVHCFPSSVDAGHFGQARGGAARAAEQADLPRPRLGFFGVIDERFDLPLLDAAGRRPAGLAVRHGRPGGQDRPGRRCRGTPNIHYFGQQRYARAAGVPGRLGRVPAAVRPQRVDAVHQPDQDARVHGGREADRQHADHRRGRAVRRHRLPGRHAGGVRRRLRARPGRAADEQARRAGADARACWPAPRGTRRPRRWTS